MKLKPFLSKHIRNDPQVLLVPLRDLARLSPEFTELLAQWQAELEQQEAVKHQEREARKIKN